MGTDKALSRKGKLLYDYIREKGGGALKEWQMRDKTGLSHGSFCAARKELVAAGLLLLGKDVRKTTYTLREPNSQAADNHAEPAAMSPAPASPVPAPPVANVGLPPIARGKVKTPKARKPAAKPPNVQEAIMPRVTGDFPDFDSWLLALNDRLGGCVDVSQSLVDGQEYIVFAEEYGEDSYIIMENEDGGICVE